MSLSIRDATVADYEVIARLQPALETPDPPVTVAQFAERMLPHVVLACDELRPIGYAYWQFYGATAHVGHVVVGAEARRRGAGGLLMQELRRRASSNGCSRWYLNVKADNAVAIRLYERSGLMFEQRGWALVCEWVALRDLRGAPGPVTFDPSEEEVARFARQHTIDPERLAIVRARPGRIFVALRDAEGMCALAAFDPNFPGIYPIAVARPEHARALFDALSPQARAPHVNLFVEGNAALAGALRTVGAELIFETVRMGAPLP
jgi:[ribosomal protein S18]-alanine N-acetyltransferase